MSVDKTISLFQIRKEISECDQDTRNYGWIFSEINESAQQFSVEMSSLIDNEKYIIDIIFDNYREIPLLLEFVHPETKENGIKSAYPKAKDSFFHDYPCICNPCSRKSYQQYNRTAPHGDWKFTGWETNPQIGSLKNLRAILQAIYFRINNPQHYVGRMV